MKPWMTALAIGSAALAPPGQPPAKEAVAWPAEWLAFGPLPAADGLPPKRAELPPGDQFKQIPEEWEFAGRRFKAMPVRMTDGRLDLAAAFGGASRGQTVFLMAPLEAARAATITVGAGANWWMHWWLDGQPVFDTLDRGNRKPLVRADNHLFDLDLTPGRHVLAVAVSAGASGFVLTVAGPREVETLLHGTRLDPIFSDHMVLQTGRPIPVWGRAAPGERVCVSFAGQAQTATADEQGAWRVTLGPLPVSREGRCLTVQGRTAVTVRDVLVGEVWLCAGQSNMGSLNGALPLLDLDTLRRTASPRIRQLFGGEAWGVCGPDTVLSFSGVGYFFARDLARTLDAPVGLIGCMHGGTMIEAWINQAGFDSVPELGVFSQRLAQGCWPERDQSVFRRYSQNMLPTTLYTSRIRPLLPYAIRGAIWYQGEANGYAGDRQYALKMSALVNGWRQAWGQGEFPFYFVQLPNYQVSDPGNPEGGDGWAFLREAQLAALAIPNTGMAVTLDVGRAENCHPLNKQEIGHRLARWALARTYGQVLAYSGPLYAGHEIEGHRLRVRFEHAESGLMVAQKSGLEPAREVPGGRIHWLAVAGADRRFHWADAEIDGATLVLSCRAVPNPAAARYAFTANPAGPLLYNRAGLPASPFRTDTWPLAVPSAAEPGPGAP